LKEDGRSYNLFCTSPTTLGKHGAGLMLYFMFIKWMAIGMFIMFILSLPALITNLEGNAISKKESMSFLDKTTLSNQDDHVIEKDVSEETSTDNFMTPTDTFLRYLTIYSDFVYSLFLIIWLIIFRIYAKIKRQLLDDV